MSNVRKVPGVPSFVPRKYHHEIQCVMQDFRAKILSDILNKVKLDDDTFEAISSFAGYAETPTGVLKMIKDIKGNSVSKRLYEIRTKNI